MEGTESCFLYQWLSYVTVCEQHTALLTWKLYSTLYCFAARSACYIVHTHMLTVSLYNTWFICATGPYPIVQLYLFSSHNFNQGLFFSLWHFFFSNLGHYNFFYFLMLCVEIPNGWPISHIFTKGIMPRLDIFNFNR